MLCTVVGSANFNNYSALLESCRKSSIVIAADGGADHLRKIDVNPHFIIGDMDSINKKNKQNESNKLTKIIKLPKRKDYTDVFCAVKEGVKLNATNFKIFGALGGRLDHSYANFCIAKYLSKKNFAHKLISDDCEAFALKKGQTEIIKDMKDHLISVFPLGVNKCKLTYFGLKYKLNEGYLYAELPTGISNVIEKDVCSIKILEGYALVFLYY